MTGGESRLSSLLSEQLSQKQSRHNTFMNSIDQLVADPGARAELARHQAATRAAVALRALQNNNQQVII